ncbi:MAG: hypothetical protein E7560_00165 [Ruminococcaceae bacterium]|nr:hypothetical protein [Oscillospiraceae bacterium]
MIFKVHISVEYYDEVLERYIENTDKNDFVCIFEEFKTIIKADLINNKLIPFQSNSPTYLLPTLTENVMCEIECQAVMDSITSHTFDEEVLKLINNT